MRHVPVSDLLWRTCVLLLRIALPSQLSLGGDQIIHLGSRLALSCFVNVEVSLPNWRFYWLSVHPRQYHFRSIMLTSFGL